MNYRAVYGVLCVVLTGAAGCAGGGEGSGNSGLTNGGVGGTFPTGGIGASGVGGAAGTLGGAGGAAGTLGGTGGVAGVAGGVGGAAGMVTGGTSGGASGMTGGMGGGVGGMTGGMGGTGGTITDGDCCPDGNCLCHGDPPSALTTAQGPYAVDSFDISTGTVYYPTDAEPPFAVIAICPGFLNSGPEMAPWGPFYASWGFVLVQTATLPTDFPDIRAGLLLGALEEVKGENTDSSSPLSGKLSDRFGTTGYSMGGGGTTIASTTDPTLKTSIGLAAWGPVGAGITTPTLLLCGQSDGTAPCNMSEGSYSQIPEATPKMMLSIPGTTHFNWFGPEDAGGGMSGERALAFQKVYLEGDTRWHDLLLTAASGGAVLTTNID